VNAIYSRVGAISHIIRLWPVSGRALAAIQLALFCGWKINCDINFRRTWFGQ